MRIIGLLLALACASAGAQGFPSKPVRLVVPVPPGGVQDTLARAIANELGKTWSEPLVVDNRPGASGIIGAEYVAKAPADGYTLFMTDNVTWMTNQFLRKLPYDPVKDFVTVIGLVRSGNVLVAANTVSANNLQQLLALARAKPGELTYGSFGIGTSPHVDTEAISAITGAKFTHVPYKGGPEILKALMAGEISFSITGLQPALPVIRQGRVKPIAFGGLERSPTLPDVPTLAESGLPGFESGAWFGWLAHSGVPPSIVAKVAHDVGAILSVPAFRDKHISGVGFELLNLSPDRFAALMSATRDVYAHRLKDLNLKLE